MKRIMLSAIAISAAALAGCNSSGGDGGNSSTIKFYESPINGAAGGFDLYETVMNSGPSSSNPFLSGSLVGANTAQIAYAVELPTGHRVTLNLTGIFLNPPDVTAGNITGSQGTVQSITEAFDGQTVFQIEGLDVDVTTMTDVIAGGDYGTFWRLLSDGGGRSLDGVFSGSGTFSVYCGANNTGVLINLTSAATPMGKFLDGC